MRLSRIVYCSCLVAGVAVMSIALIANAQPKPSAAQVSAKAKFKPVQSIHDMMEGQKKLWTEIREGILDKQWDEASKSAWILAEIANVNQYQHESKEYKGYARKMSSNCAKLAKLLKKREEKSAKMMVTQIGETCSACHDQFK